jgi:ABC-type antimicrobial peptide transport system permease subunit
VAYVNWEYAANWDKSQLNSRKIYRVQLHREFQGRKERYGTAPMALASYVRQNFKEVSKVVRYQIGYSDIRIGEEVFATQMIFADSGFFDLFTYELKYGSFTDFHDKGKVFISDETALKYFNREDAVGQPLTQIVLGKDGVRRPKEYIVGGVFKQLPDNSSFNFEVITLFDNFWDINLDADQHEHSWKRWTTLFLQIDNPEAVTSVTQQLQNYIEPQNEAREDFKVTSYYLENFDGMMKRNRANPRVNNDWTWGTIPDEAITVPAIMAGLLLLLACFNFTNTSIAISSRRLKEIGIRKVMGSMRSQLVFQDCCLQKYWCLPMTHYGPGWNWI